MSAILGINSINAAARAAATQVARQGAANIGTSAAINTAVGATAGYGTYLLPKIAETAAPATQAILEKLAVAVPSWIPFIGAKTFSVMDTMVGGGIATAALCANNLFALATGKGAIGTAVTGAKAGYGYASQGAKSAASYIGGFFTKKAPQQAAQGFLRAA